MSEEKSISLCGGVRNRPLSGGEQRGGEAHGLTRTRVKRAREDIRKARQKNNHDGVRHTQTNEVKMSFPTR